MKMTHRIQLALVSLGALVLFACGGDSGTRPSVVASENGNAAAQGGADASEESAETADVNAFALAYDRLGAGVETRYSAELSEVESLNPTDWAITLMRFAKNGQSFKVNRYGMSPQPAPRFRIKLEAPMNIPQSVILILFNTAGGKECGLATTPNPFPLTANTPRNVDIPNNYIIVGPEACLLDGQKCNATWCKFPLTTTKMRILFGNVDQGTASGQTSLKYKWNR
jgi:hypothetical protein